MTFLSIKDTTPRIKLSLQGKNVSGFAHYWMTHWSRREDVMMDDAHLGVTHNRQQCFFKWIRYRCWLISTTWKSLAQYKIFTFTDYRGSICAPRSILPAGYVSWALQSVTDRDIAHKRAARSIIYTRSKRALSGKYLSMSRRCNGWTLNSWKKRNINSKFY